MPESARSDGRQSQPVRRRRFASAARSLAWCLAGIAVALPILAIVFNYLAAADDGFEVLAWRLGDWLRQIDVWQLVDYCLQLVFGIPVACYICGSVVGNRRQMEAAQQQYGQQGEQSAAQRARQSLLAMRVCPQTVPLVPLACLAVLYLVFFAAMGQYLFSALHGGLPESYTYAQYARRGFFELCAVAAINLALLAAVYTLVRRSGPAAPLAIRVLSGVISAQTCLLIITAASKMLLYIQAYGLTPLRLYTSWFMILMLLVFLILCVWHLRPVNITRPLTAVIVACFLALALINTDGLIVRFNIDRYVAGQSEQIDAQTLAGLSDAALPALRDLSENAPTEEARQAAQEALRRHYLIDRGMLLGNAPRDEWFNWNLTLLE